MPKVTRRGRLMDLGALLCILAGVALCLVAYAQFQELSTLSYKHPGPRTESALAAADHARYLAYGGTALILAGCAAAVSFTLANRATKKQSKATAAADPRG